MSPRTPIPVVQLTSKQKKDGSRFKTEDTNFPEVYFMSRIIYMSCRSTLLETMRFPSVDGALLAPIPSARSRVPSDRSLCALVGGGVLLNEVQVKLSTQKSKYKKLLLLLSLEVQVKVFNLKGKQNHCYHAWSTSLFKVSDKRKERKKLSMTSQNVPLTICL